MTCQIYRIVALEVIMRIAEGKAGREEIFDAPAEKRFKDAALAARRSLNRGASRHEAEDLVAQALGGTFDGVQIDRCSDDPRRSVAFLYRNA